MDLKVIARVHFLTQLFVAVTCCKFDKTIQNHETYCQLQQFVALKIVHMLTSP